MPQELLCRLLTAHDRHEDVQAHDVGADLGGHFHRGESVAGLRYHLDIGKGRERLAHHLANQPGIVDEQDADLRLRRGGRRKKAAALAGLAGHAPNDDRQLARHRLVESRGGLGKHRQCSFAQGFDRQRSSIATLARDDDNRGWLHAHDFLGGAKTVHNRHEHIHGHDVWPKFAHAFDGLASIAGFPYDLDVVGPFQRFPQHRADERRIVHHQHARLHERATKRQMVCQSRAWLKSLLSM